MSQEFDAIYEGGVFRPLEQVDLPDRSKVHLQVRSADPDSPPDVEDLSAQRAALRECLEESDRLAVSDADARISARDHDQILYGWKK